MDYILIIGANSDIGQDVARCYARNGYNLYLASRQIEILKKFSNDLNIRYDCEVEVVELDVLNYKMAIGSTQKMAFLWFQDMLEVAGQTFHHVDVVY